MARRKQDDDLLMEDELTAAFLGDDEDTGVDTSVDDTSDEDWLNEEEVTGQLAVDVYESPEYLYVQAPIAGINKAELDVSITDNTVSIQGSRSSGVDESSSNYFLQECYWGEFSRSLTLPVSVKEEGIEAVLKDGVLTIKFEKVNQETVRKIEIK